jgi:hypothetical protein
MPFVDIKAIRKGGALSQITKTEKNRLTTIFTLKENARQCPQRNYLYLVASCFWLPPHCLPAQVLPVLPVPPVLLDPPDLPDLPAPPLPYLDRPRFNLRLVLVAIPMLVKNIRHPIID